MTTTAAPLIVYTTPPCPDCRALKAWLEREGIPYVERDLADPDIMAEAKARTGVRVAPITARGDWFTHGTFEKQRPEISAQLGRAT